MTANTRRASIALALAIVIATAATAATAVAAPQPRASLTDIEQDVMCVSCHEPLALAQSPQADSERAFISALIAKGETKAQIENQLETQYGPSVLGKPPAHGFNLTVYVLPPAIVLLGLATLAIALPRWRRRARASKASPVPGAPPPSEADARRLEEDLASYRG